jgi:MFS family permease
VTGDPVSGARPRVALVASVVGAAMVALDGTVLIVAQPSMRHGLRASVGQLQWTSTGYLVAVASLLVIAGRLGDRYGHRRLLLVGSVGFATASAGIAVAPTIGWVIGLRVAQGVGGALLQPATLALLRLAYPAERLPGAVALRTGVIGLASAAGPVLGGALVSAVSWRAVFVVTVPVALASAAAALAVRLPSAPPAGDRRTAAGRPADGRTSDGRAGAGRAGAGRLDLGGAALLAVTLGIGVHTLVGVPADGWLGVRTLVGYGVTGVLAVLLVTYERRTAHPTVPAAVARSRPVVASMAVLLLVGGGMFGALFTASFLLQDALKVGALGSGLRVLPLTVLMVVGAPVAGVSVRRFGARRTALAGTVLVAVGVAGLSRLGPGTGVVALGCVFGLLGAGFAAVMVTGTGTVVGEAPPGYAGVTGGLKQTAMNIGPTLGIAVAAGNATAGRAFLPLALLAAAGLVPAALLPPRRAAGTTPTRPDVDASLDGR